MLWTPAHFWALAILLKDDYASVGIPMLPSVKGSAFTVKAISRYGWATVFMSILGVFAVYLQTHNHLLIKLQEPKNELGSKALPN